MTNNIVLFSNFWDRYRSIVGDGEQCCRKVQLKINWANDANIEILENNFEILTSIKTKRQRYRQPVRLKGLIWGCFSIFDNFLKKSSKFLSFAKMFQRGKPEPPEENQWKILQRNRLIALLRKNKPKIFRKTKTITKPLICTNMVSANFLELGKSLFSVQKTFKRRTFKLRVFFLA